MKYLILGLVLNYPFTLFAAAMPPLTLAEVHSINAFTLKVNKTRLSASDCLTELVVNKSQGIKCKEYQVKITALNKAYLPVMKIKPNKRRFLAIARNNSWYYAFKDYDHVEVLVNKINRILLAGK